MGTLALTELHTIRRISVDIPSLTADCHPHDLSDPEPQRCEADGCWMPDAAYDPPHPPLSGMRRVSSAEADSALKGASAREALPLSGTGAARCPSRNHACGAVGDP
jgi:hypothetical protein